MKSIITVKNISLLLRFLLLPYLTSFGQKHPRIIRVETIEMPKGLSGQTGGIDFLPDGRLVACFMRGEVMTIIEKQRNGNCLRKDCQLPLGILAVSDSEVLVMNFRI